MVVSFTFRGRNWIDAEDICQSHGGHLASISNLLEQNFVSSQTKPFSSERFWIGYNDRANKSNFKWFDGTSSSYQRWRPGEPAANGSCVSMNSGSGMWSVSDCEKEFSFICKGITDRLHCTSIIESFYLRYAGHGTESKTSLRPITARKIIAQPIRMLGHDSQ